MQWQRAASGAGGLPSIPSKPQLHWLEMLVPVGAAPLALPH